jgi:S-DNA-T family DNA segregation ATPase FtsK/SpoIIIE
MGIVIKKYKKDLVSILWFAAALFLTLSLYSFHPSDPSFNSLGRGFKSSNLCGIFGSFMSDGFFQLFGLAAWFLPIVFAKQAWDSYVKKDNDDRLRLIWTGLVVFLMATMLGFYLPESRFYDQKILSGGFVGMGLSKIMIQAFNQVGVQIVLWSLTLVMAIFYFDKNIKELLESPVTGFQMIRALPMWKRLLIKKPSALSLALKARSEENNKTLTLDFKLKPTKFTEDEAAPAPVTTEPDVLNDPTDAAQLDFEGSFAPANLPKRKVIMKAKPPRRVENWEMPKLSLLEDPPLLRFRVDEKEIKRKAEILTDKLKNFNIEGHIVDAKPGPLVTMYEFKPNADVKLSKITELQDDLSLALSSESLRVIAPIPGRDVVGIETSNIKRETVYYKDLLAEESFWNDDLKLPIALGRQVNGEPRIVDLRKMPHLLVAGTTGSGKSVLITSIITGLLFKHSPKTLKLILVDPKQVDLAAFAKIPHLIMPPVTEPRKAVSALKWAIREMEKRYKSMSKFGARGLESYNEFVTKFSAEQLQEHEKINQEYESQGAMKLEQYYYTPQPYIVIVVEEFGDLMAVDKQNVEQGVVRLAQMARACGIHLILAMQSPRKEVVTGLIKTNIPGRVGLKVASKMDSRIILDEGGAERLLPNGDMLFLAPGIAKPMRHHGPYLSENEINGVAKFWSDQSEPEYDSLALKIMDGFSMDNGGGDHGGGSFESESNEYDEMYDQILAWTAEQKEVSASLLQRRFRLGYPRAARIIEIMEKEGVVSGASGSKARQVLVNSYKET